MRRSAPTGLVEIEWLTGRHRRGLRRRLIVPTAEVFDLSMGGMLVQAPGRPVLEVGDPMELASDGHFATAQVMHKHVALDPGKQLLGLGLTDMSEGFAVGLHEAVRAFRD